MNETQVSLAVRLRGLREIFVIAWHRYNIERDMIRLSAPLILSCSARGRGDYNEGVAFTDMWEVNMFVFPVTT